MNQLLIKTILIILLIISLVFSVNIYFKSKATINRLANNIEQLETDNSIIKFTNGELKSYLKAKDTFHKNEIDSILKLLKIKPKNLIRYQSVEVNNINTDSTLSVTETPKVKNDSTYQVDFLNVRKCIEIKGYVESIDPNPRVIITSTKSNNKVYILKSYKKSFWDVILFRKGKEMITTTSECGEVNVDEIEIIK